MYTISTLAKSCSQMLTTKTKKLHTNVWICMKVRKDSELGHYVIYFIYDVVLNYNIGYIEIKKCRI